jgi:pilus assembly protein CpaE
MNAPFQARAGLRDPFTAFVCDDATAAAPGFKL